MNIVFNERSFRVNIVLDFPLYKIPSIYPLYWKVSKVWAKFGVALYHGKRLISFYEHLFNYLLEKVDDKDIDSIETPFNIIMELKELDRIIKEFIEKSNKIHKEFKEYYETAVGLFDEGIVMSLAIFPFNTTGKIIGTKGHNLSGIFVTNSVISELNRITEIYEENKEFLFYGVIYSVHEILHYLIGHSKKKDNPEIDDHLEEHVVRFLTKKILLEKGIISENEFKEYVKKAIDPKIYEKIKDYSFEETIFEFLKKKGLL